MNKEQRLNIDLSDTIEHLFHIAEMINGDVGILIKQPDSEGQSQVRVVVDDEIRSGYIWRGFSDNVYFRGRLFGK